MKIVRYMALAAFICSSQISLSMDYPISRMIKGHATWLDEQLTQLGYLDLNAKVIGEIVAYFTEKTNAFYRELIQNNKIIAPDLLEQEISIAAGKIVSATAQAHAKEKVSKTKYMLSLDDVIQEIIYSSDNRLYEGAINQFPKAPLRMEEVD